MKSCKKFVALLLAIISLVSIFSFSASACLKRFKQVREGFRVVNTATYNTVLANKPMAMTGAPIVIGFIVGAVQTVFNSINNFQRIQVKEESNYRLYPGGSFDPLGLADTPEAFAYTNERVRKEADLTYVNATLEYEMDAIAAAVVG